MTAKNKFKLKKLCKIHGRIVAFSLVIFLMTIIIILSGISIESSILRFAIVALTMVAIFSVLLFSGLGTTNQSRLKNYMRDMKLYRERNAFRHICIAINLQDLDKAVNIYNGARWMTPSLKFYIFGFITGYRYNSNDIKVAKVSIEKHNEVKIHYHPDALEIS